MSTTVRVDLSTMVRLNAAQKTDWADIPIEDSLITWNYYYAKLSPISSEYKKKILENVNACINIKSGRYYNTQGQSLTEYAYVEYFHANEDWNPSTITYDTRPSDDYDYSKTYHNCDARVSGYYSDRYDLSKASITTAGIPILRTKFIEIFRKWIDYGFHFKHFKYHPSDWSRQDTSYYPYIITRGTDVPYIELVLSDTTNSLSISSCSPTSGFLAKYTANTFNWSTIVNDISITDPTIASAKFRYRANSSSAYTEINCGSALSYTMPANTIATNSFQWQVAITDTGGTTSTSDWFTISTEEALSSAAIVSPKNVSIDGSEINRFEWQHIISTGTEQTKAELQYSSNGGSTWNALATPLGAATYTNIAANRFSSGSYLWRVRTYNTDVVAGTWSDPKPFTVIAKPVVRAVTSEQNPKPKITWQSDGQQAFRVYIDGVFDSGVIFGTSDSYTLPIYLEDGSYTVNVIVQNSYGLWSNPASGPINVTNVPGTVMVLTSYNESDGIRLMWTEVLSYAYYVVYRDDVAIAKIRTNEFKDLVALGEHEYFIRGIYASSKNYGLSNKLNTNNSVSVLTITNLETAQSIEIEQSDSSMAELNITDTVVSTSVRISSSDYPINEVSHFKTKYIRFDCAFIKNSEISKVFRTFLGEIVCIKTPSGTSIVGNLLEQKRTENYFYEKYSCSLNQTNYAEEIQL